MTSLKQGSAANDSVLAGFFYELNKKIRGRSIAVLYFPRISLFFFFIKVQFLRFW